MISWRVLADAVVEVLMISFCLTYPQQAICMLPGDKNNNHNIDLSCICHSDDRPKDTRRRRRRRLRPSKSTSRVSHYKSLAAGYATIWSKSLYLAAVAATKYRCRCWMHHKSELTDSSQMVIRFNGRLRSNGNRLLLLLSLRIADLFMKWHNTAAVVAVATDN